MIVVHVEHFLNEEGQRRYPAWLRAVAAAAEGYPGYLGLRRLIDADEPTACHMLLEFADGATLATWVASPERAALLAAQEPYRLGTLRSRRFVAEEA